MGVDLAEAWPSADGEVKLFKSNRAAMKAHGRAIAMLALLPQSDRFVSKLLALRQLSLSKGSSQDLAMGRLAMLAALIDVSAAVGTGPRMVIDHGPESWEWHSFGQGLLPHPECCMVLRDP